MLRPLARRVVSTAINTKYLVMEAGLLLVINNLTIKLQLCSLRERGHPSLGTSGGVNTSSSR